MKMNFGLSMSICFGRAREYGKEKNIGKTYLRLLDYFLNFALKNEIKIIEIGSFPPFDAGVLEKIKSETKRRIEKFKTIYHLPSWEINICAINSGVRKASLQETKKLIKFAKDIGIKRLSLHPGCYTAMPDIYALMTQQVKSIAKETILDIFEKCRNNGLELAIENLPFNEPFFQKPEEFEPFIERGIGMLIDTAHAVTSGVDPIDFVKKFQKKISEVHLVDGFKGKKDIHYALGMGELDYLSFLKELAKIKYKGPIILELKSEKDFFKTLNILKKTKYF